MTEKLFKIFFIISYESSFEKQIKYNLSNENGMGNLKISFTKKFEKEDNKEYIVSVLSFDINNIKEENRDEKTNLFKAIIKLTIQDEVYGKEIFFREGKNNFIYNFIIESNPSIILLGQSSQLKIFYEALKKNKK